jgi:hypothetical protein
VRSIISLVDWKKCSFRKDTVGPDCGREAVVYLVLAEPLGETHQLQQLLNELSRTFNAHVAGDGYVRLSEAPLPRCHLHAESAEHHAFDFTKHLTLTPEEFLVWEVMAS